MKEKVLICSPVDPFEFENGGVLGVRSHILMLASQYELSVFYITQDSKVLDTFKKGGVSYFPYFTKSKRKKTSMLLSLVRRYIIKTKSNQDLIDDFKSAKFSVLFKYNSEDIIGRINAIVENNSISIVEIHFIQWASLVYSLPSHIKTVFVHHELRSLRLKTQIDTLSDKVRNEKSLYIEYIKKFVNIQEFTLLNSFDYVILVSSYDLVFLKNNIKISLNFSVMVPAINSTLNKDIGLKDFYKNSDYDQFLFVGGSDHPPNRDGLFWLLDLLNSDPGHFNNFLPISVTGYWDKKWKKSFGKYVHLLDLVGYVDDFELHTKNKILICSIRVASGVRMKLLMAMYLGIPIITTFEGALGLDLEDGIDALFFSDLFELKKIVTKINNNEIDLNKLRINANRKFKELYSFQTLQNLKLDLYREITCKC
jgi:glycosyltransferase involved in cell wall biosynthesis